MVSRPVPLAGFFLLVSLCAPTARVEHSYRDFYTPSGWPILLDEDGNPGIMTALLCTS